MTNGRNEGSSTRGILVDRLGGPDVLRYGSLPKPSPAEDEALVRLTAIGVNFIDVYFRTGTYPSTLPFVPGQEAAGVVEAVGSGVEDVAVGDRVAFATHRGSYAEYAAVPARKLVPVPDGVDDRAAAAAILQGMAAHYLTHATYPVERGDTVLVHAVAGGLGLLLAQMARRRGATVIGTTSSPEKAAVARDAGVDHVILYTETDFEADVRRLTGGEGVAAVYDSVGKATFDASMRCLRRRGYMVLCGLSSGPVPAVDPALLQRLGSLFLTRTSLADHVYDRESLLRHGGAVLQQVAVGDLQLRIAKLFPLAGAAEAHRALESRSTAGKLLLVG